MHRPHLIALALILVAGFALRVWNIDYGLPFVYSIDEASHFTSRAVEMFWQDLDPGYYQNPATYTYLVYALLRVMYGPLGFLFDLPFGQRHRAVRQEPDRDLDRGPDAGRGAVHGGVAATYWAARRLWGIREGLVAAAVLAFAFLPVAYSRVAVTDVGALIGVALSLGFAVRADERGRSRWFLLAGGAAGLAVSFKYTAGLALLPLAIAATRAPAGRRLAGARRARGRGAARRASCSWCSTRTCSASFDDWWSDLRDQAEVARDQPKPGQESGGLSYYLDSLTWGLGWAAAIAALAGAVHRASSQPRARADAGRAAAGAVRLPERAVPLLRPLAPARLPGAGDAGGGGGRPGGGAGRRRWRRRPAWAGVAAAGGLTVLLLAQPLAADVRTAQVLGRDDTRQEARDWLEAHYPPELRVSIEPAVPGR